MKREDFVHLVIGCVLFVLGLIAFLERVSIAVFLGANAPGLPADARAQKVFAVALVGAGLSVIGFVVACAAVWRSLPSDDKKEDNKKE
jgi:hypothetical protein